MFKNKLKISAILIASALTVSTTALANGSELSPDSRSIDSPDKGVAASTSQVQDTQSRISQLSYIAQDQNQSVANRANALQELRTFPSQNALVAVARGLKDKNPEIREAAIIGSEPYQLDHRWKMVSPLLEDPEVMVRHTAASNLVRDYNSVTESQKQQLDAPVKELIAFLEGQSTEEYQLLFADVLRWYNQWAQAETVYVELLKHRQEVPQVWLSYADNFRAQGKDNLAVETLDRAIEIMPDNSALHYSKSLTLVRLNEKKQAAQEIEMAANLAKNNSYYWYLNGVLQEHFDIDKSTAAFEKAYMISGAPEQLYAVCDIYVRYGNSNADECLAELSKVAPEYIIEQLKDKKLKG